MLLGDILKADTITASLHARERFAAIDELIDLLVGAHVLPASLREHVAEVVKARERSMSTGMEDGVALPHGATDRVDHVLGALGLSADGIDFGCLDGRPARLVILLVLPRRKFQVHVRTLAGISHLLNGADFRHDLFNARDAEAILRRIREEEQAIKTGKPRRPFNPFG